MLETAEEFNTLIELSDENVLNDLDEHNRALEDMPTSTEVVDRMFTDFGQDTRAVDSVLVEDGYVPHRLQEQVHKRMMEYRFTVLVCHRRWGKTVLAINALCHAAVENNGYMGKPGRYAYLAPLLGQAKQVSWLYLKAFAARVKGTKKHEGELYVEFPNGSRITLYGASEGNSERLRGLYLDGAVFDEPSDMPLYVWPEIVRPALADHNGWVLFIGTPRGINMFSERYEHALKEDDWLSFMFKSSETKLPWLPQEELVSMQRDLSDSQWRQEMECDFGASSGNVIILLDTVNDAVKRDTPSENYLYGMEKVVGIDPAWMGEDKTAVAFRWGLHMYPIVTFDRDEHDLIVGYLERLRTEHEPDAWQMDQSYGEGIYARAEMVGIQINLIAFGGKARNESQFGNRVTEMFFDFNHWLLSGGVLPDDEQLKAELTSVTYQIKKQGQHDVRIRDPKSEIYKKIGRSPDKADACVLTVADKVLPAAMRQRAQAVKVLDGGYHPHKRLERPNKSKVKTKGRKR